MAPSDSGEDLELKLVLEAIHEQYGYDFRGYARGSLLRRFRSALARSGAGHLGELQHRLIVDPAFFSALLDELTVHTSEMFRDPEFYRTVRDQIVPVLRTYPQLKIWHAGCAAGEEVYAVAILLEEENLYERTQIYATDVSRSVLDRAKDGVYSATQVDAFEKGYLLSGGKRHFSDYTTAAYGRFTVREALRKNVVFFQHDLVSDYALGEMQMVLCRNVFLYFGARLRERAIDVLTQGLCRGGFLCLGASEQLPASGRANFDDFARDMRIYRRRAPS